MVEEQEWPAINTKISHLDEWDWQRQTYYTIILIAYT